MSEVVVNIVKAHAIQYIRTGLILICHSSNEQDYDVAVLVSLMSNCLECLIANRESHFANRKTFRS